MHHTGKTQAKCGQQSVHDVEGTGESLLSVLEKKTGRHFNSLFKQLNFGSRREVHGLLRTVAQLERLTRADHAPDHESGRL